MLLDAQNLPELQVDIASRSYPHKKANHQSTDDDHCDNPPGITRLDDFNNFTNHCSK